MTRTIWKQTLSLDFTQTYEWPAGAKVIHGEIQNGEPRLWFICDPSEPRRPRTFTMVPTGGNITGELAEKLLPELHVATFLLHGGELVAHLFEVGDAEVEKALEAAGKTAVGA